MYLPFIGRDVAVPLTASFALVPVPLATRIARAEIGVEVRRANQSRTVSGRHQRRHHAQLSCLSDSLDSHNRVRLAVAPLDMCAGFGAA